MTNPYQQFVDNPYQQFVDQPPMEPPKTVEQNFFERFGDDLKKRFGEQGSEIIAARVRGDQGFMSTALQLTGKVGAGSIMDFLGESLVSAGRGLKAITPPELQDWMVENATKVGLFYLDTDIGRAGLEAAKQGAAAWDEFKEANPVSARNIESVVNIGLLIAPVRGVPTRGKPGGKIAAGLDRSARRSEVATRRKFIDNLIRPEQNPSTKLDQVGRTSEKGLLRQKVVEPTQDQKLSALEVRKVPGVSPRKSLQGNYNAIAASVTEKARKLENALRGTGTHYRPTELERALDQNVRARLRRNPALVGDAEKTADRIIDHAIYLASRRNKTLYDLLVVRRQLDEWVIRHKPKAFESGVASNAMTSAAREVRGEINKFIAARAGNVRVEHALSQQSRLLRAMDDIRPKVAKEYKNRVVGAIQDVLKVIPWRNEMVALMSVLFGMGGLGAAGTFAPFISKIALGSGLTYGVTKTVMSPKTRRGLSQLIKFIDEAIRTTSDPSIAKKMRLHRAAIVEIVKGAKVEEDLPDVPENRHVRIRPDGTQERIYTANMFDRAGEFIRDPAYMVSKEALSAGRR